MPLPKPPPTTEAELLARCRQIEGLTFAQLAAVTQLALPANPSKHKGWVGGALELALGADAKNQALPDFKQLGIELKTLPLNDQAQPAESTFVTTIPLLTIHQETWETSTCFKKLQKVLWMPVEGAKNIPYSQRRIGRAILWSPSVEQATILKNDWTELTTLITLGKLNEIDATMGDYLQIRPKAANAAALCHAFDAEGNKSLTLPRGFYLRTAFTKRMLNNE